MSNIDAQKLIEAGVHFGCRVSRWNPKMAPYIHGRRGMIHVIDLRETVKGPDPGACGDFHIGHGGFCNDLNDPSSGDTGYWC